MPDDNPEAVWEEMIEKLVGETILVNIFEVEGREIIWLMPLGYNGMNLAADGTLYLDDSEWRPTSAREVVVEAIEPGPSYPEGPEPADVFVSLADEG